MPPDRVQLSPDLLVEAIGDDWPSEQVDAAIELLATSEGRFPSGTRKLPVELVRAIQRERLIAAMLDAAATRGYRETNVQDVIERAGVSRPTFYEHFTNKDDCFLAAFDAGARRLRTRLCQRSGQGRGLARAAAPRPRRRPRLRRRRAADRPHPDRRGPRRQRRGAPAPDRAARRLRRLPRRHRPRAPPPPPRPLAADRRRRRRRHRSGPLRPPLPRRARAARGPAPLADVLRRAPVRGPGGGKRGADGRGLSDRPGAAELGFRQHPGEVSEWLKERDWKSRGRG